MVNGRRIALHDFRLAAVALLAVFFCSCAGIDNLVKQGRLQEAESQVSTLSASRQKAGFSKLGAAYLAKGDLESAYQSFAKAEDKAALTDLSDRFLKAGSFDLCLQCWQEAGKTVLFRDEFTDNKMAWELPNGTYASSAIQTGKLTLSHRSPAGSSSAVTRVKLDPDLDFRMETRVTARPGSDGNTFGSVGIIWGLKDLHNQYAFTVSMNGHYTYMGFNQGRLDPYPDPKESAVINTGSAANTIAVVKLHHSLLFYVNGTLVDTAVFPGLPGDGIGLAVNLSLDMEAEYFLVEQYPSAGETLERIGAAALASADFTSAARYYALAQDSPGLEETVARCVQKGSPDSALLALKGLGLPEAKARVRLSSMLCSAGRRTEALAQLQELGWKPEDGLWKRTTKTGAQRIESRASTGELTSLIVPMDPDADFMIQARIRQVSGKDDPGYSLIWGLDRDGQRQEFGVRGGAGVAYGYYDRGAWKSVVDVPQSPSVRAGNGENVLTVVRSGDRLRLFVNGAPVIDAPYRAFLGDRIGTSVSGIRTVEVEALEITEYYPDFSLDLARTELFASRPDDFARLSAPLYLGRGMYEQALAAFTTMKDETGAHECHLRMGQAAAIAGNADMAAGQFLQAGESAEAYRGLVSAYEALGRTADARAATERLADRLFAEGDRDEALTLYLGFTRPALLDAAGLRYLEAGDFASAASLFTASGNKAREKESEGREAERLVKAGDIEAGREFYLKGGFNSKAAELEKRLTSLSPTPLVRKVSHGAVVIGIFPNTIGMRIVDGNGFSIGISQLQLPGGDPFLLLSGSTAPLSIKTIARASLSWKTKTVSVVTLVGESMTLPMPDSWLLRNHSVTGVVYQADVECEYRIDLSFVVSLERIGLQPSTTGIAVPADDHGRSFQLIDRTGAAHAFDDIGFYYKGAYNSGYSYGGLGEGFEFPCLSPSDLLEVAAGSGTRFIPRGCITELSFKDTYYVSPGGYHCPLAGAIRNLVAIAGNTPTGRVAVYPSTLAGIRTLLVEAAESRGKPEEKTPRSWSVACYKASETKPFLTIKKPRSEVLSPDIDWDASDPVLAFRAALEDLAPRIALSEDRTQFINGGPFECDMIPIIIGQTCRTVPFMLIKELGMDAKGNLSISLKDGSVLQGLPFKNWVGLAGESAKGDVLLKRQEIPARVVFQETAQP
jgi:tetratricopeptide (TPR) repeat protein